LGTFFVHKQELAVAVVESGGSKVGTNLSMADALHGERPH
jgi:hypothetical protein